MHHLPQANDLNSNKAINAYFEDPTGPQTQVSFLFSLQVHFASLGILADQNRSLYRPPIT